MALMATDTMKKNSCCSFSRFSFFKELGFSSKQIQKVLGRDDFDQLSALYSHRKSLNQEPILNLNNYFKTSICLKSLPNNSLKPRINNPFQYFPFLSQRTD
jgi:hypothetical protein